MVLASRICFRSEYDKSAADVKIEIPVLVRSLKSSILSSTSFQIGKTSWGVASAAIEQSRRKSNLVAQGDGKFGPQRLTPESLQTKKKVFLPRQFFIYSNYLNMSQQI